MQVSPNQGISSPPIDFTIGHADQRLQLGTRFLGVSPDYRTTANLPNPGGCEAIYVRAGGTFNVGRLVHVDKDWNILDVPTTVRTGRPVYVMAQSLSTTNPFGFAVCKGIVPVQASAAFTAGIPYIAAAGQITSTLTAGAQLMGATGLIGSTGAFTKTLCKVYNANRVVKVPDTDGLYNGLTVSGTGVPGATTIASIDIGGRTITLSADPTATTVPVTLTFTHTGFAICHIESPMVQSNIT